MYIIELQNLGRLAYNLILHERWVAHSLNVREELGASYLELKVRYRAHVFDKI